MEADEVKSRVVAINRKSRLKYNEDQMEKAVRSIASNLKDIHDNELWKDTYVSFQAYCEQRWGIRGRRAYQILEGENARLMLADAVQDDPVASVALETMSESAIRAVARAENPIKTLKDVTKRTKRPTVRDVTPSQAKLCPHCGKEIS